MLNGMTLLRRLAGAATALAVLAGGAGATLADDAKVSVALDWTPNTNHVGLYIAQAEGYFKQRGLDVTILPYADTSAGTLVSNGKADFGVVGSGFFAQHAAGADLRAVYAVVQHDTGRLVVEAKRKDIASPKDLDGKTYGGFGSKWESVLISNIIKADGGKGDIKTVTLGTSAYEALRNGSVDFTLEIATWEGVEAALAGEQLKEFKYSDYGVPEQHTTFLASSDAYLKANADTAKAFLAAVTEGYAFAADHPDKAAEILIGANKSVLTNTKLVEESLKVLAAENYLRSKDGVIGRIDPDKIAKTGAYLLKAGILVDENGKVLEKAPDFSTYFSNDYLPK
jgi:ABC-type nitrate/sulfonate/bicarbonate transport system substrate-binding protein